MAVHSTAAVSQEARQSKTYLDASVGTARASGALIRSESSRLLDITLGRQLHNFFSGGLGLTFRAGGGRGDICEFVSETDTRCKAPVPTQSQLNLLLGSGLSFDGIRAKVLLGPVIAFGGGESRLGGSAGAELGVGGAPVGVVLGYRQTKLLGKRSDDQSYSAYQLGVRFILPQSGGSQP